MTRRLRDLGHDVFVANSRGPDTLSDLAKETGAKPVTVAEAAHAGEVVIVTIPERNIPQLPKNLFADLGKNVVVVDTGNYYPQQRDGKIQEIENGMTESRWVERQLRHPSHQGVQQYICAASARAWQASWNQRANRSSGRRR